MMARRSCRQVLARTDRPNPNRGRYRLGIPLSRSINGARRCRGLRLAIGRDCRYARGAPLLPQPRAENHRYCQSAGKLDRPRSRRRTAHHAGRRWGRFYERSTQLTVMAASTLILAERGAIDATQEGCSQPIGEILARANGAEPDDRIRVVAELVLLATLPYPGRRNSSGPQGALKLKGLRTYAEKAAGEMLHGPPSTRNAHHRSATGRSVRRPVKRRSDGTAPGDHDFGCRRD